MLERSIRRKTLCTPSTVQAACSTISQDSVNGHRRRRRPPRRGAATFHTRPKQTLPLIRCERLMVDQAIEKLEANVDMSGFNWRNCRTGHQYVRVNQQMWVIVNHKMLSKRSNWLISTPTTISLKSPGVITD